MKEPMPPEVTEYAPQYTRQERIRQVLWMLPVAAFVLLGFKYGIESRYKDFVDHVNCRTVLGVSGVRVLFYGLFVGLPLLIAATVGPFIILPALAGIRARQYPAPGRKVRGQVKIRRGRAAVVRAWLEIAAVGLFVLIALWGLPKAADLSAWAEHKKVDCSGPAANGHVVEAVRSVR
jgi:hypothetical protein